MNERQAHIEKMKAQLDEWSAEINKLEAQAQSAQADVQLRLQKQLDDLKGTREDASKRLKELQDASADAWETMRQGAETAWDGFAKAFKDATNRFK